MAYIANIYSPCYYLQDNHGKDGSIVYKECMETIEQSAPKDWEYDEVAKKYTYLKNPSITIVIDKILPEYYLDWATDTNRTQAYNVRFLIMLNNIKTAEFFAIQIDRNAYIPAPISANEKVITKKDYHIGKILNIRGKSEPLDELLDRLGISVAGN